MNDKSESKGAANAASMSKDPNPNQPTDRQVYLGDRLELGIPAIVRLNKSYGREAVTEALAQLHGFPPAEPIENVYGWVATVASFKNAQNGPAK